jgi:alkylation response protein AidB-like acyl-CoA dehydrogenase
VNFSLTEEQELLREAAVAALSRLDTVAGARAALEGDPLPDLWPTAREAGWTGLLIDEHHGGAGLNAFDAMLVMEQCGRRLTGAGLIGHLTATMLLTRAGHPLLPSLAAGEQRAAVAWEPRFQPDVAGADWLVVRGDAGLGLIEAAQVAIEPIIRYDASRPLGHLELEGVSPEALEVDPEAIDQAWYLAQALLAADALGVSEAMLELSVAYAKDRYAFGRPIGSYQAIKQQIVEILRHAGTTRSLCFYAGYAAEAKPAELALAASAARFAAEEAAEYATRTCIAVHGGIGATWEHDAHLYWRRAQLSRLLLGGVAQAGDRVAEEIIARARELERSTV